jgi:hypothetical protein
MIGDDLLVGVQIATVIVSITWVVAQIRGSTRELNITIHQLRDAISELKVVVNKIDDRVSDHGERLTRIEARIGTAWNQREN